MREKGARTVATSNSIKTYAGLQELAKQHWDKRLCRLYEKFRYIPEGERQRLKECGCVVHNPVAFTPVAFTLQGKAYSFRLREFSPYPEPWKLTGSLELLDAKGNVLCAVHVELQLTDVGTEWIPLCLIEFVPSEWVPDFLKLTEGHYSRGND